MSSIDGFKSIQPDFSSEVSMNSKQSKNFQEKKSILENLLNQHREKAIDAKTLIEIIRETFQKVNQAFAFLSKIERKRTCLEIIHSFIDQKEIDSNQKKTLKKLIDYSIDGFEEEKLENFSLDDENDLDSSDEIAIPSKETSLALAKLATDEVIEKNVKEASRYIRLTKLEIDEKVSSVQQKFHEEIENVLSKVDQAKDKVKEALKGAQELSSDLKGEVIELVDTLAEKLLDTIQKKKEDAIKKTQDAALDLVEELDEKAEERESLRPSVEENIEFPLNELIAK